MNKILKMFLICFLIIIIGVGGYFGFMKYQAWREEERIRNAIIKIDFINPLEVEFNTEVKVSDLITSINGEYITNPLIDTSTVGKKKVSFKYLNEEEIKVPYSFEVSVVDKTPPVIWLGSSYTITKGYSGKIENKIVCADNYDDNPSCIIKGEYNVNIIGNYPLRQSFHKP